jgi:hypothetical protein
MRCSHKVWSLRTQAIPGCQAKTGEAASIMSANNPKSTINLLNFFSFPEQGPTPFTDA